MSASINGYLTLGTGVSGGLVVPPPANAGYAPQPVSFTTFVGGVTLNGVACLFGPATAPWGTLTSFGIVDLNGNPVQPPGTLQSPFTPRIGETVTVPQGNISIVVGSQFTASVAIGGGGSDVPLTGPMVSGSVVLTSGAYSPVLASGARAALVLTNADQANTVRIILGGISAPAPGASGYSVVVPFGSWPPPGMGDFVSSDAVWAIGTAASGQLLNYLVAQVPVVPVPPLPGAMVSGSVALSAGNYTEVLPAMVRDAVLLTNADQANAVRVILGGATAPSSGALGYSLIGPFGSWPPPGLGDFVPDDTIWAMGTANGQVLNTLYATPSPPDATLPVRGPTASGSIALASGSYSLVLGSAWRNALLLTNADQANTIRVVLGGTSAPPSGALGYSLIPPFGSWPPPGLGDFVPDDSVWAIGTVQGQTLNYMTG